MEIKKCENCGSEHIHAITKEIGYSCSKCGRNTVRQNEMHQTNADRVRSMTDEELAEWLTNMCGFIDSDDEEPYKSIYNIDTEKEEIVHDSYGSIVKWLQSEVEEKH